MPHARRGLPEAAVIDQSRAVGRAATLGWRGEWNLHMQVTVRGVDKTHFDGLGSRESRGAGLEQVVLGVGKDRNQEKRGGPGKNTVASVLHGVLASFWSGTLAFEPRGARNSLNKGGPKAAGSRSVPCAIE